MQLTKLVMDRSAVLLLGVSVGVAIGFSFLGGPGPARSTVINGSCSPAVHKDATLRPPEVTGARQCAAPAQRQLISTLRANRPVRVAVFGDSYGDGVWSGLQRQLKPADGYQVIKYSQPASGFTRYRTLNLEAHAAEQLGDDKIDVAVISFGANDAQGIITDEGKHAPLMGDLWKAQIGKRIERYVALLRQHNALVYWVGLPRMRDAAFDAQVGAINDFYASEMAKLDVPFLDSRPVASDTKGQYAAYLPDPKTGERTLMRAGDGIHMSMTGYVWITRVLAGRIRDYVDATRTIAEPAPKEAGK
ncbi:DUF459 domain-containing protein [Sphingomonas sp. R-74633]|nr:DUF459 domain-containing protein [Sphingomonas sp. R-74633]